MVVSIHLRGAPLLYNLEFHKWNTVIEEELNQRVPPILSIVIPAPYKLCAITLVLNRLMVVGIYWAADEYKK